jgi:hypothetical protein
LKGSWSSLQWGYQEPERPDPQAERLFVAGGADIDAYGWSSQALTLTSAASERLLLALAQAPTTDASVAKLNALKQRLGHGNAFERALYLRGFFVALDGEPLYWGIFLDPPSQMAIEYPVLRAALRDAKAVFHVLPLHLPFFASDPGPSDARGLVAPEAREVPGGMIQYFRDLARSPRAVAFRARIRDDRVRQVLEQAGKLRP